MWKRWGSGTWRFCFLRGRLCGARSTSTHDGGLGAGEPDGGTVVVEVRASALFEGLGGGVEEAHACEVVVCLAVGQYVETKFCFCKNNKRTIIISRQRKSPLILPEVVMTAGRKRKLRSL